jgi:uncharacterized protein (TIGR03067 family)
MRLYVSFLVVSVLAIRGNALPPPTQLAIPCLIEQLGSASFPERQAATKALEALGERALPFLQKTAKDTKDAEVRRRAQRLVEAVRRPAGASVKERLYGSWRVVSQEYEGRQVKRDGTRREYTFAEPTVRRVHSGDWGSEMMGGTYQVGIAGDIGTLDLYFALGDNAIVSAMIYRLDDDTLQFCYAEGGMGRPERFETRKGTKLVLLTLMRVKP